MGNLHVGRAVDEVVDINTVLALMQEILIELKKQNMYLSMMFDETITEKDIGENI